VSAVAAPEATLLMLAFPPGRRGPLPRGVTPAEIEAAYPGNVTEGDALDAELPRIVTKDGQPHWVPAHAGVTQAASGRKALLAVALRRSNRASFLKVRSFFVAR